MPNLARRFAAALVAAGLLVLSLGVLAPAGAAPPPPFVTDNVNYPNTAQAGLPAGCDFTGIVAPQFFLNGLGELGSTTDGFDSLLAIPPFKAGDLLTMTWSSVTPVCVGVPVALTVKHATSPFFDINALQPAAPTYGITTATAGAGSVSLVLPDLSTFDADCFVQLDAIVGIPLAFVGPIVKGGSYYSAATRGDTNVTTLISFNNGQYAACAATTTTSTTVGPPTTVTVPPPTTTTLPGTPSTTGPPPPTTTTAPPTRTLAATGRTHPWVVALGSTLVLFGVAVLFAPRLRRAR